jgi:hypothetical protein
MACSGGMTDSGKRRTSCNSVSRIVAERAHEEAQILFSSVLDERLQGVLRVSVLATKA